MNGHEVTNLVGKKLLKQSGIDLKKFEKNCYNACLELASLRQKSVATYSMLLFKIFIRIGGIKCLSYKAPEAYSKYTHVIL